MDVAGCFVVVEVVKDVLSLLHDVVSLLQDVQDVSLLQDVQIVLSLLQNVKDVLSLLQDVLSYEILSQSAAPFSPTASYFFIDRLNGIITLRESLFTTNFTQFFVSTCTRLSPPFPSSALSLSVLNTVLHFPLVF